MSKYTDIPCPVCGKEFTDFDDIVVCPECGAPHHRDCYKEMERCVFSSRHEDGFAWKNPNERAAPKAPSPEGMSGGAVPQDNPQQQSAQDYNRNYAPGQQNSPYQSTPGSFDSPQMEQLLGVRIDESIDDIPVKDYAQFVGPNAYYYLLRFKMLSMGSSFSFNFSALVFGFLYYFHRKMYKWGFAMLGLFLLFAIPVLVLAYLLFPQMLNELPTTLSGVGTATFNFGEYTWVAVIGNYASMFYFAACFMSGFFANRMYYGHVKKNISYLRERFLGRPDQELSHALAIRGRTNKVAVVALIGIMLLCFILFEVFLVSTYQSLYQ